MKNKIRGVILLCAGQGSRMGSLTKKIPKCLLHVINENLVIDYLLKNILQYTDGEIIAVAGFNGHKLKEKLASSYGDRVKVVLNKNYLNDTNIYSVDLGVSSLNNPENGYLIVETDILLDPNIWMVIFQEMKKDHSFWVCKSYYNENLTGGIVHATNNQIDAIAYKPSYDANYLGWNKMLGIMSVGPNEVKNDIKYRQRSINNSIEQYYFEPWCNNLNDLPCKVLQIDQYFAKSFNTENEFIEACDKFSKIGNYDI